MRSANAKTPAPAVAENGRLEVCQAGERDKLSNGTTSTKTQVASIPTGRSSQVRVHLRKWHDITKIEIAHFTEEQRLENDLAELMGILTPYLSP